MALDSHKNFAFSSVATAPSPASSGTSLVVTSTEGSLFPTAPFNAVVWPTGANPSASNAEIVRVTLISTDTLTITRAQESSSARSIVIGDQIAASVTAKTLTDIEAAVGDLPQTNTAPSTDETLLANYCVVVTEEYVMDDTHELIFSDPSELMVI